MTTDNHPVLYREDLGIKISGAALVAKQEALEKSSLIGKVTCAEEQAEAVAAQVELAKLIKSTAASEASIIDPLNAAKKAVWGLAAAFVAELQVEESRIAKLNADYAALLLAQERSALAAQNQKLLEIEREREAVLAKAGSLDERDEIHERFDAEARALPAVEVQRAEGQRIRQEWEVTVSDIHALYRHHSHCVKLTPLLSEVKALLEQGVEVKGVKAEKVVRSGVVTR